MKDEVLLNVEQAAEVAEVSVADIRLWRRSGRLPIATRMFDKGSRRHRVYFTRGAVETICRGTCPLCGSGFRRANIRQVFCTDACRKNAHRIRRAQA